MYYIALGIIVLELLFFVLNVRKSISGKGASGVPLLTFIAFLIVSKYLDEPVFFETAKVELLLFALFHIISHFIIPVILKKKLLGQASHNGSSRIGG